MPDDKRNVLAKVRALFERAGRLDTPIEEARTSALLGARLFVKHALGLTTSSDEELEEGFDRDEEVSERESEGYDWNGRSRSPRYDRHGPIPTHGREPRSKEAKENAPPSPSSPPPPSRSSKPRSPRAAAAQSTMNAWATSGWARQSGPMPQERSRTRVSGAGGDFVIIDSDFVGRCVSCGESYKRGDRLAWRPKHGATHYGCRAFWSEDSEAPT